MTEADGELFDLNEARHRAWEATFRAQAIDNLIVRAVGSPDAEEAPSTPLAQLRAVRQALRDFDELVPELAALEDLATKVSVNSAIKELPQEDVLEESQEGASVSVQGWHEITGALPQERRSLILPALEAKARLLRRLSELERKVAEEWPPPPKKGKGRSAVIL
jgi:ribonuclease D